MRPRRAGEAPIRIAQRRISRLGAHLLGVPRGGVVAPVLDDPASHVRRLEAVGFVRPLAEGQVLLPAILGRRSRFNADGDDRPQRERPKERVPSLNSVARGPAGGRERSVHSWSYARYPRTRIPGPGVELRVVGRGARRVIATETFRRGEDDVRLAHTINLLLELFGECTLLREDPPDAGREEVRLNWERLPAGADPAAAFAPATERLAPPVRAVAWHRLRRILDLEPDVVAVGRAGYAGCGVFGFSERRRFVVESLHHDNATHVSGHGWDELSRRSKSDLLAGLPGDRHIPHERGWETRLRAAVEG